VRALVAYAFNELYIEKVSIHCATDNLKSRAIPERLGFKEMKIVKNGEVLCDISHDIVIYSHIKNKTLE